jgi:UrcA family protein
MKRLHRSLAAVAAMITIASIAGAAGAQPEYHLSVGDLSQPSQAAAFSHKLDEVARRFCTNETPGVTARRDLEACRQAIRDEAMSQLTAPQREQYAAFANGAGMMAHAGQ